MSAHPHIHRPKETPKVAPVPTEHETQFFRHPVKTTRYHSKKTWFKIAASTVLIAALGGMGTWLGSAAMDWANHHRFISTDDQKMIHQTYWKVINMQRDQQTDSSNLWHAIHQMQNPTDEPSGSYGQFRNIDPGMCPKIPQPTMPTNCYISLVPCSNLIPANDNSNVVSVLRDIKKLSLTGSGYSASVIP